MHDSSGGKRVSALSAAKNYSIRENPMKSKLFNILIVLMFFVGLSVLLYPAISDYLNQKKASKVIATYNSVVNNASSEHIDKLFSEAAEYNNRLMNTPSAFYNPALVEGYENALDILGIGVMGYIYIDKIKVELPIYHGTSDGVLQVGVGHLEGTSLPVGGKGTHCVLSGHRGLPSAKLFTNLNDMRVGDVFRITILDRVFTYEVDQILTVLPKETDELQAVPDKDYCTLMTCTPYGINTHRLLVRGVRIANAEEKPGIYVSNEAFQIDIYIIAPIFSTPLLLALLILLIARKKRRRKKRDLKKAMNALKKIDEETAEAEEAASSEDEAAHENNSDSVPDDDIINEEDDRNETN